MEASYLKKYAELLVKSGLNIQQGQILVISCPIEGAEFARMVAETAYQAGAGDVEINWVDEGFTKIRYLNAPDKVFEEYPNWKKEFYLENLHKGAAFLSISASDPELLKDVDPNRLSKANKTVNTALREYKESMMANKNAWCVASIPTKAWAMKVFPDLDPKAAVEKLWRVILQAVRVNDEDPVEQWESHKVELKRSMKFLNGNNFSSLHFKNKLGTDLEVQLPKNHIWLGGSEFTPEGVEFLANIPTEEVFTLPERTGINGRVVSTKPLNYNGNLIDGFSLTFKEGKIVDFQAQEGYETLKNLIETDEGSCYLGEVALVPYESPISLSDILYYNTLFDENASCHLALGKAYPVCLKDGEDMGREELLEAGANDSLVHVDFMIGSRDLEIIGTTQDGRRIQVFKEGNFSY